MKWFTLWHEAGEVDYPVGAKQVMNEVVYPVSTKQVMNEVVYPVARSR